MMNVTKRYAAIGWLVIVAALGFSPVLHAENGKGEASGKHDAAKAGAAGRPTQDERTLPEDYATLLKALEKANGSVSPMKLKGVKLEEEAKGESTEIKISTQNDDVKKLLNWVETFKSYRAALAKCKSDRGSEVFGEILDGYISTLLKAVQDPARTSLMEKEIITYTNQMESFIEKKHELFRGEFTDANDVTKKQDDAFKAQLKKTAALIFGDYRVTAFDETKALADGATKPVVVKMAEAKQSLEARKRENFPVCKFDAKPAATTPTTAPTKAPTQPGGDTGKQQPGPTKTPEKPSDPVPPTGNPGPTKVPGEEPTKIPGEEPTQTPEIPGDPGVFGGPTPQGVGIDPGATAAVNQDDLGRLFDQRFNDLKAQQDLQNQQALRDVQNALDAARRLADDIARQQQQQAQQDQNRDDGLAAALAALGKRNNEQPQVIQSPPSPPSISASPESSRANQQPIPQPPPVEPEERQQAQMPFFPPPQQPQQPILLGEPKKFDDEYLPRRPLPPPQDPRNAGLLELVRLQQQMMLMAQQQQGQRPANVNSLAARLQGMGRLNVRSAARRPRTSSRLPVNGSATSGTQANMVQVPGARTSTVPTSLRATKAVTR